MAAVISAGKKYGYAVANSDVDEIFSEKKIFSVGGLPIVAQTNWDEMFNAILKRMPDHDGDHVVPMSEKDIEQKFGVRLPPGDYPVNVIGDDFPGFDTGQITEDYEPLRKHRGLGKWFGYMIDDMKYSKVWTANKEISDIVYKSGFPMTSDFGSWMHRNCEYNAADHFKATILAYINLSDDSLGFVIGLTPEMIGEYLSTYGLSIKKEASYNYDEYPFVGFLKVDIGKIFRSGDLTFLGNLTSRYYGLAHQEREIEQDLRKLDRYKADVRGIWKVTGNIEIDALISKLASYGSSGRVFVRYILEMIKDTDLGRDTILAISRIKANSLYESYRDDLHISFPPNWLADIDATDLITAPEMTV
jgi:hypothetical protein